MAAKTTEPKGAGEVTAYSEQPLLTIESLRDKCKIARPVYVGVCAARGWKPGRAVTEEAFLQAVAEFTRAPMGGDAAKEDSHA